MKKLLLITAISTLVAMLNTSSAQTKTQVRFQFHAYTEPMVDPHLVNNFIRTHQNLVETKPIRVNTRVMRHFVLNYENSPQPKWFKSDGGYIASFNSNGIDTRIVYDERSHWFYNIYSYPEMKLEPRVKNLVKGKYFDHDIIQVNEYNFKTKTVYLIKMQDPQSRMVTVKIADGKMEIITSPGK